MKLKKLDVKINTQLVREIIFKDGLNLITNMRGVGRSGNSVGKSTLSRVIDYLFLASIDSIYIDDEFKKPNEQIEYLFRNSLVDASLSFVGLDGRLHTIERRLSIPIEGQLFYFDGIELDESAYQLKLLEYCFDVRTKRPSVRALAPKFIRNTSHRMLNTTKFLEHFSGGKDYSELFLYLFGFANSSLLTTKREATNVVAKRKRISTAVNALIKEQKPRAEISIHQKLISDLERDFLKFEYAPEYDDPLLKLIELQDKEDSITKNAFSIERKVQNINDTIAILSQQGGNHLIKELEAIYQYAGVSVGRELRDIEEVLAFHDNLVAKKKQFLSVDLPELESMYSVLMTQLSVLHSDKLRVFADMRSTESISNITSNLKRLGELKVALGKLQGLIEQQASATRELELAEDALSEILTKITNEIQLVEAFETKLNEIFGLITEKTHAEKYAFHLNFNKEDGNCNIEVETASSNPEGGKKKAEVIAFDLAYMKAVEIVGLKRPKFVFHDGIEDIDQKQIDQIFSIARDIPGQEIVSMLSDKLSSSMYDKYSSDIILLLSEDDKFFRV